MWRAFGIRHDLVIVEEQGLFVIKQILARTGEAPHEYYVPDGEGRGIGFTSRVNAEWFCQIAEEHGLEEAERQRAARFKVLDASRPADTESK